LIDTETGACTDRQPCRINYLTGAVPTFADLDPPARNRNFFAFNLPSIAS